MRPATKVLLTSYLRKCAQNLLILGCSLQACSLAFSQDMSSPEAPPSDAGSLGSLLNPRDTNPTEASPPQDSTQQRETNNYRVDTGSTTLTANQIITILHAKPEALVDVKHVMAGFFLKEGIAVQENSITDEMLFSNIATNAALRQTISSWLRAREYAADADFDQSTEPLQEADTIQPLSNEKNAEPGNVNDETPSAIAAELRILPEDSELLPQGPPSSDLEDRSSSDLEERRLKTPESPEVKLQAREADKTPTPHGKPAPSKTPQPADADKIEVLHQSAPYNLQALRDLYTQIPEQTNPVKRFGADVFLTRGTTTREMPIDLPVGPDYVLGPGDGLTIAIWGGVSLTLNRVIDSEGKLVLPEAGSIVVAGLTLDQTQALIQGALSPQFRDAHVSISVARLRTVRVYVLGDVQRPGAYDLSSLSTPLNALYAAGGPTSVGSLRTVRHYRGDKLIREVDLYGFLLHGVRVDDDRLEPGDTILVPVAGPQVEVSGMVKRPAIYEFKDVVNLSNVLDEAGGLRVTASLAHIRIERIEPNGHRSTVEVGLRQDATPESARKQMDSFAIKDGDRVIVAPIVPYSERSVYLTGHVVRPGKLPYHDAMKLSEAIRSYQDLLPEPSDHGEIIRLIPPDLRPEAIDFSLTDVLAGSSSILLEPFDTIRIRGRYEDDAPKVTIRGEVLQPGAYALTKGMTASQLVRIAGGFKRSALLDVADLASYEVKDGKQVVSRRTNVAIGQAVNDQDTNADIALKPGDVLTVHQISGWNDIGASITLVGEVIYPGTYGLQEGEKLSSVIQRAGGFRSTAYPDGAVLVRKQVQDLEEKSRAELIRQIESTSVGGRLGQSVTGSDDSATLQLLVQQQEQVLQRLRAQPAVGRLVIKIGSDIASWANTSADIELRSGDVLAIPKRPGFVLISGQVYNASAITYEPGKDAAWYLRQAGGATDLANSKEIFVIRANGMVVGRRSDEWYGKQVLSTRLNPGDVVVVPRKIVGGSVFWKNMLASAQVFSSIAFTAALALH
jgi:protein involved in polysaccharide export with SLBB domain